MEQAAGAAREAAQARVADAERAAEGLTRLPGEAGLARTLAIELGPRQIMVSAIAPGMVRTPMLAGMTAGRISQLAAGYPGGRLPEAEDIAQAIAFFGDPQTMFITGQVLIVDGGRSVGLSGTEPHGGPPSPRRRGPRVQAASITVIRPGSEPRGGRAHRGPGRRPAGSRWSCQ